MLGASLYAPRGGECTHSHSNNVFGWKNAGAVKFGRDWAVPSDAERPTDKRVVSGEYKDWRKKQQTDK